MSSTQTLEGMEKALEEVHEKLWASRRRTDPKTTSKQVWSAMVETYRENLNLSMNTGHEDYWRSMLALSERHARRETSVLNLVERRFE